MNKVTCDLNIDFMRLYYSKPTPYYRKTGFGMPIEEVQALGDQRAQKFRREHIINPDMRIAVLNALTSLTNGLTVSAKVAALQDPIAKVRVAAAVSLGSLPHPTFANDAIPALRKALRDCNKSVRDATRKALAGWESYCNALKK